MKKFLLFALCAISACSVFAEPYSNAKSLQLYKAKKFKLWSEYCFNSEISAESGGYHVSGVRYYLQANVKNFTKQQAFNKLDQFKNIAPTEKSLNYEKAQVLASMGFADEALRMSDDPRIKYAIYAHYRSANNKEMMWKYGTCALLTDGGYTSSIAANQILTRIFRYKPASVTKEQQIELLSKLAQMYPIPGTDFNQWKGFMGFVGFKYKALTGKELF